VYGVVAFTVARRTKEIGVRRALGAQDRDVIRLVLRGGLALAVPGIVVGIGAGLVLSRLLRSFILGVAPGDPVTFLAGPAILLIAVVLACWAPARRALAAQPTEALRAE
jgi:ABC-type antimicrobial peptide transport system permease subunit